MWCVYNSRCVRCGHRTRRACDGCLDDTEGAAVRMRVKGRAGSSFSFCGPKLQHSQRDDEQRIHRHRGPFAGKSPTASQRTLAADRVDQVERQVDPRAPLHVWRWSSVVARTPEALRTCWTTDLFTYRAGHDSNRGHWPSTPPRASSTFARHTAPSLQHAWLPRPRVHCAYGL